MRPSSSSRIISFCSCSSATTRHCVVAMGAWSAVRVWGSRAALHHLQLLPHKKKTTPFSTGRITCFSSSVSVAAAATDLSEFLLNGLDWKSAPKCPDYVGPLTIKRTPDGRGRGLYASQNVTAGDVLLVSNPIAASYDDPYSIQLFTKLVSVVRHSPTALLRLYSLADSGSQNDMFVPSVDLFNSSAALETPQDLYFDEKRILHIMKLNSFEGELTSSSPRSPAPRLSALWLLPSFLNHSCHPNASRLIVGEAMFIHAATDIQASEEITIAYSDVMLPLKRRQESFQAMGCSFRCECTRCLVERSVEDSLKVESERFQSLYSKAVEEVQSALSAEEPLPLDSFRSCMELSDIFDSLRKKTSSFVNLTKLQKQWILAGYSSSFLGKWLVRGYSTGFAEGSDFVNSAALEVVEAMKSTVPGMLRTLSFTTLLIMLAQKGEGNLGLTHRLIQMGMDQCIRVYGKQKPEVVIKLMEQSADIVPFF